MRYFEFESREGTHWRHYRKTRRGRSSYAWLLFPFHLAMIPFMALTVIGVFLLMPFLRMRDKRRKGTTS